MPRPETEILRGGDEPLGNIAPLTTPIYQTTTFVFENAQEVIAFNEGRTSKYLYSRYGNPTVESVERTLAALDQADAALLCSSGMGAIATMLMAHTRAGDEVVCSASLYGGTLRLLTDLLEKFGVSARYVPLAALADPLSVMSDRTRILWFESPTNPMLGCVDIAAIAGACRSRGVLSAIDNTFATPINQPPIPLGVDLVMQSATKYLNGHSDVTAGVVAGSQALLEPVEKARRMLGTVFDPWPAYELGRGLKTLGVRMKRHNETAQTLAEAFDRDRRVSRVYYPGLPSHPDHDIARRQMSGFGGMICIDLGADFARAERFFDRVKIIRRAASLGGVESLVSLPVLTSHWGWTDDQLAAAGITKGMVRLSVGLEDPADLIADIDQALSGC
jgi:cystathionine beta-lyase/cystathionine gamma-synthase